MSSYFQDLKKSNDMKKKEYYTEDLEKSLNDKIKALKMQKYYTGGSVVLMFLILLAMYLVLN